MTPSFLISAALRWQVELKQRVLLGSRLRACLANILSCEVKLKFYETEQKQP